MTVPFKFHKEQQCNGEKKVEDIRSQAATFNGTMSPLFPLAVTFLVLPWKSKRGKIALVLYLATVSSLLPIHLFGNFMVASLICPLRTLVKHSCWNRVGFPMWTVRVTSVVPSLYCPPESTRYISSVYMIQAWSQTKKFFYLLLHDCFVHKPKEETRFSQVSLALVT